MFVSYPALWLKSEPQPQPQPQLKYKSEPQPQPQPQHKHKTEPQPQPQPQVKAAGESRRPSSKITPSKTYLLFPFKKLRKYTTKSLILLFMNN